MRFVAAGSAVAVIGHSDVVFGHAIEVATYRAFEPAYRTRLRLTVRDVAGQGRRRGRKLALVGLLQEHLEALYGSKPVSDKPKHIGKIAGFGAVAKQLTSNPSSRMG